MKRVKEFVEAIRATEWESNRTCEECGEPGGEYIIHLWGWTLCSSHAYREGSAGQEADVRLAAEICAPVT